MGWFLHGTWSLWHSSQWLVLYCMKVSTPEERQKKFFLVSKSFCFADSQSLLCEVDNWVYKSYIFPSSLYVTNLILYFGFNAATKEGICLLFSSLPLPPQPVFHSSCVLCPGMWRVLHLGRKWLELLWKLILFPAQLRNCVTRLL